MMDERFAFGANWRRFLETVDESRIAAAMLSLQELLGVERLDGLRFLDVGSGSGLFSLAAYRLGATVCSFDYDPQSVACTLELRQRFADGATAWRIEQGSALDAEFLQSLGPADVVYSWGVLHHTGEMWRAIDLVAALAALGGLLAIALYNDQGELSDRWSGVKRLYLQLPGVLRPVYVALVGGALLLHRIGRAVAASLVRLLTLRNPFAPWRRLATQATRPDPRGMHRWYDLVDWVGGWPFEVARPENVLEYLRERGFELERLTTCGGNMGCNEYVFRKK
jgi:SAM-dependent methyltransferase